MISKTSLFILVVLVWFGARVVRAETALPAKAEPTVSAEAAATTAKIPTNEELGRVTETPLLQKAETEIPVQLESKKSTSTESNPVNKMVMGLVIVLGTALAAWMAVKKYNLKNNSMIAATQMKILSQHHLGPKKTLMIVRVAGESLLIGVTDQNISMLKSLSLLDEDVPEETPKNFNRVFDRVDMKSERAESASQDGEEFAIGGIRDFVSNKLKNMRSFE